MAWAYEEPKSVFSEMIPTEGFRLTVMLTKRMNPHEHETIFSPVDTLTIWAEKNNWNWKCI